MVRSKKVFHRKKGEIGIALLVCFYGFFLSISTPTMAIAMIMAIAAIVVYNMIPDSIVASLNGVAVGAGVAGVADTPTAVSAYEL